MNEQMPAYVLWGLVLLNSLIFILFAFTFFKPETTRDWRSFGAFSAFIVALFTEMYGFPLTIYVLSGWLQSPYPDLDWLSHDSGHLFEMMFGWKTNPHFGPFLILSFVLIGGGFMLISAAWRVLYEVACTRNPRPRLSIESGYFQALERRQGHGTERQVDRGDHPGFARSGSPSRTGPTFCGSAMEGRSGVATP